MDEDEVLSKITRLLEQGCTMLATHHDCGAPLFRCQGEVVCPVCSFPDESLPAAGTLPPGSSSAAQRDESVSEREPALRREEAMKSLLERSQAGDTFSGEREDAELMQVKARLRASLLHRLSDLTAGLEAEQDLDKLKKQLDCVEGLLRVFRSM